MHLTLNELLQIYIQKNRELTILESHKVLTTFYENFKDIPDKIIVTNIFEY